MQPCEKRCGRKARTQKEGRWICATCLSEERRDARERERQRLQAVWARRERSLDVVGESRRLDTLHVIIRGHFDGRLPTTGEIEVEAVLRPEPGNRADSKAVAVYVDDKQVGYVPRDMTHVYRTIAAGAKKHGPTSGRWIKRRRPLVGVKTDAVIGWGRPEVVGVSLVGIDIQTGAANIEPIFR